MSFDRIGEAIAEDRERLAARVDVVADVRARLFQAPRRARRRPPWRLGLAAAALALVVGLFAASRPRVEGPLTFELVGRSPSGASSKVEAGGEPVTLAFSDGTRVTLGAASAARVTSLDPRALAVRLTRGELSADVRGGGGRRWFFHAGPFTIHVTGTRFDVRWEAEARRLHVALDEGRVVVTGGGLSEGRALAEGERIAFSAPAPGAPPRQEPPPAPAPPGIPNGAEDPTDDRSTAGTPRQADPRPGRAAPRAGASEWRRLAEARRFPEASRVLGRIGFERVARQATAEELLVLANVSRFSGDRPQARRALLLVRSRFPRSPSAAMATFTLGRLAFDDEAAYAEAARWFRTYLDEAPAGPLAREATGRLLEALVEQGRAAEGREIARAYLRAHPSGAHAALARRVLAE